MYCSQCATQLSPDDVYCPACAKPVASFAIDGTPIPQVEPFDREQVTIVRPVEVQRSNKSFWMGTLAGILGTFAVVLFALFFSAMMSEPRIAVQTNTSVGNSMNGSSQPTPTP